MHLGLEMPMVSDDPCFGLEMLIAADVLEMLIVSDDMYFGLEMRMVFDDLRFGFEFEMKIASNDPHLDIVFYNFLVDTHFFSLICPYLDLRWSLNFLTLTFGILKELQV